MTQLIPNGPDVPNELLQAHEEGEVVLFCGAGISRPAGLPIFSNLVEDVFLTLNESRAQEEERAFRRKEFDRVLELLEVRRIDGRRAVRRAIATVLSLPEPLPEGALTTHKALLDLATTRDGKLRLVTTNFDLLFERLRPTQGGSPSYQAPFLPPPKNDWSGLIYLHGRLSGDPDTAASDHLVASSGDFGSAYLTERWASIFVTALFRAFTVCFVGYSVDDPVLRYMMDALAAERRRGNRAPDAYAFAHFVPGTEVETGTAWRAKGVLPILYRVETPSDHSLLHDTIREWARWYGGGVEALADVVSKNVSRDPRTSSADDDFAGRVLWALSHPTGLPAKRFAACQPLPSLDWLEVLNRPHYSERDLRRFGIELKGQVDGSTRYSFLSRPAPLAQAPRMGVVVGPEVAAWDHPMWEMAAWFERHLSATELLLWFATHGARLHPTWATLLRRRVNEMQPSPLRKLWHLLLSGRAHGSHDSFSLIRWQEEYKRSGMTPLLRLRLKDLLRPYVRLSTAHRIDTPGAGAAPGVADLVGFDVQLSCDHAFRVIHAFRNRPHGVPVMQDLLEDATDLLHDVLSLMHELEEANADFDLSHVFRRSISDHRENRENYEWVALIDLAREGWVEAAESNADLARAVAHRWLSTPYPLFRRLAFFAFAARMDLFEQSTVVRSLLDRKHHWLWSNGTRREVLRLLAALSTTASTDSRTAIEEALLLPLRRGVEPDVLPYQERATWDRLIKFGELGENARVELERLSRKHPSLQVWPDQREEVAVQTGLGDIRPVEATPQRAKDLRDWVLSHQVPDGWHLSDWAQRCRLDSRRAVPVLLSLAAKGTWPASRWSEALQVWGGTELSEHSRNVLIAALKDAPEGFLRDVLYETSSWLEPLLQNPDHDLRPGLGLATRLLQVQVRDSDDFHDEEPNTVALNHPTGRITKTLIGTIAKVHSANKPIDAAVWSFLDEVADQGNPNSRHGRLFLCKDVAFFKSIDPLWTTDRIFPCFSWSRPREARVAWSGFLWPHANFVGPLEELIDDFLSCSTQSLSPLDPFAGHFARTLAVVALYRTPPIERDRLRTAVRSLRPELLGHVANQVFLEIDAAQPEKCWLDCVEPFLVEVWAHDAQNATARVADSFAQVCISAGAEFPRALAHLTHWIAPIQYAGFVVTRLLDKGVCTRFPGDALRFLSLVTDDSSRLPRQYRDCLNAIAASDPTMEESPEFRTLRVRERNADGS